MKRIIAYLCIALYAVQIGCAHSPQKKVLSEEERIQVRNVAILEASLTPESYFAQEVESGTGTKILRRFGSGLRSLSDYAKACYKDAVCMVLFIVAMPVAIGYVALTKGNAGGEDTVPQEKGKEIEQAIKKFAAQTDIQKKIADHLLTSAVKHTEYRFDLIDGKDPNVPNQAVSYNFLKEDGFDSALEATVVNTVFIGGEGEEPSLVLSVTVHARLIRPSDGKILYAQEFLFRSSDAHTVDEWNADKGLLLQETFNHCNKILAEAIVDDIFSENRMETQAFKRGNDPSHSFEMMQ